MTPDRASLKRDIAAAPFLEGTARGWWRLITISWPHALFGVAARDGREFVLRLDCMGYPAEPPTGGLWDMERNAPPQATHWPQGDEVFRSVFRQDWKDGTALYFPLDRVSRTGHGEWPTRYPHLVWRPERGIVQYLAEVHRHLNSRGYYGLG